MTSRVLTRFVVLVASLTFAAAVVAACANDEQAGSPIVGGNPSLGKETIRNAGCGSCHTIPGIKGADALVGPPLIHWSKRGFIAGELKNTPDNLIRWIQNPQSVEPGTDMPNLHLSRADATNVAAYLMTIK